MTDEQRTIDEIKSQILALFPVGSQWYDCQRDEIETVAFHFQPRGLVKRILNHTQKFLGDITLSIIYDYEAVKRGSDKCNNSGETSHKDQNIYLVYCYCRGRHLYNTSCACFGTPKFYGPDRA